MRKSPLYVLLINPNKGRRNLRSFIKTVLRNQRNTQHDTTERCNMQLRLARPSKAYNSSRALIICSAGGLWRKWDRSLMVPKCGEEYCNVKGWMLGRKVNYKMIEVTLKQTALQWLRGFRRPQHSRRASVTSLVLNTAPLMNKLLTFPFKSHSC